MSPRRGLAGLAALVCLLAAAAAHAGGRAAQPLAQVDVSNDTGIQAEVAVAVDPSDTGVLLAGSNSIAFSALSSLARVYGSMDGGATWTSRPGPPAAPVAGRRLCNYGDPAVAVGRESRQYYAFLAAPCLAGLLDELEETELRIVLEVATRAGPTGEWRTAPVFPTRSFRSDDKPAIAVDASPSSPYADRVYVTWTRITLHGGAESRDERAEIVLSRTDDAARSWSKPVVVGDRPDAESVFASVVTDRSGQVFVAWTDERHRLWVDRSTDGGASFGRDVRVDRAVGLPSEGCDGGSFAIPAQRKRCVTSTPLVSVDDRPRAGERVYVTYGAPASPTGKVHDVFVAAFDGVLRPLLGAPVGRARRVNPPDGPRPSDQFMPAAAVDSATGVLWVCFYDTTGDRRRERSFYSCTASRDGGATWALPVRAASVASKEAGRHEPALFDEFQFGDYQGLAVANGVAHPIWTDTRDLGLAGEEIYTSALTEAQLQRP